VFRKSGWKNDCPAGETEIFMASISLLYSTDSLYNTTQTSTTSTAQKTEADTTSQEDSVKLSEAAQAKLLYKQGQSVSAIASLLGTTAKAIDDDLGLTLEKTIEKTLEETSAA
jgi:hypothetical protein